MFQGLTSNRSFVLIGAALALPIVLLVVIQLTFAFSRERAEVEARTLAQAGEIMALVDARLQSDLVLMEVLASADVVEGGQWRAAYERAGEIAALNPHWRDVIVSDLETERQVFSLRQDVNAGALNAAVSDDPQPVGRVLREGPGCPCVYLNAPIGDDGRYRLTVALDPSVFQEIVQSQAPADAITALVDRDGAFVARSQDFTQRVGTQSTEYVRRAIASGEESGIYEGVTWEGFRNNTAFVRSSATGWSAHIAIAAQLIEGPRTYSFISVVIGALLALALAAALIVWALRDLAERRAAEARLAQTQKLEAIGQLTGGVAHDFNNLLTVVIGGLNMLLKRIEDPKQRQIAEHMLETAQRGDRLTKQLLAFSRGKQMELAPVDLHELVPGMEELLRRSVEAGTTLTFDLHPDARWIKTDANQLELGILNLVINARDAMPDGGKIDIIAKPSQREGFIDVEVRDNGIGMPKDVADRAMEPFFTTKPAGKGTGLGLAQVFGAVRQSGGNVEIDSAPGRGTTIRLSLPRTEAPAATVADVQTPAEALPQGAGQRVLVVDDEPGVRLFMAETLRDAGYQAVEAEDPGAALRLLENGSPDLLLTDFSMPGMTGLELAEHARRRDSALKVLIVSGYADAGAIEASASEARLLRKPFDERELIEAVRDVLAA
ncbi:MAG: response regulator [Hyphomonadaceae bacterium]|nr:response regulator [Hyphomonadaceae bacterium]